MKKIQYLDMKKDLLDMDLQEIHRLEQLGWKGIKG